MSTTSSTDLPLTESEIDALIQSRFLSLPEKSVRRAAQRLAATKVLLEEAIYVAHMEGISNRAIAKAAGVSHEQVRRILARA